MASQSSVSILPGHGLPKKPKKAHYRKPKKQVKYVNQQVSPFEDLSCAVTTGAEYTSGDGKPIPFSFRPPSSPSVSSSVMTSMHAVSHVGMPNSPSLPTVLLSSQPSLGTKIALTYHGEPIAIDLSLLPSDSGFIIELLKLTSSDRAHWMMVGAYYRRIGNPQAAISVMNAMLEAMAQHGIAGDDLKPAYLLLSSCESYLARHAKNKNVDAKRHYNNAVSWLQKVYGVHTHTMEVLQSTDTPSLRTSTVPDATNHAVREVQRLKREVYELNEHQRQQSSLLSEVRAAKRKVENELKTERCVRRKLEEDLALVIKERDTAVRKEVKQVKGDAMHWQITAMGFGQHQR